MVHKHIVLLGTATANAGETILSPTSIAQSFADDGIEYAHMDVLIYVKAFAGTSVTFSIREQFSGVGYVETAKSAALTATGNYMLCADGQTGQTGVTGAAYGFASLGKGGLKEVVTTCSSVTNLNADIYCIFYR